MIGVGAFGHRWRLRRLRTAASAALEKALGDAREVALVNYPDIGNVGDAALWLGTMRLLARLGRRPRLHVPIGPLTTTAIDRLRSMDVVLLNGGGNFGDLWRGQQETREQVIDVCRRQRIVQLPQTCRFESSENLDRMRSLVGRASDLTLMWREDHSLRFARAQFDATHMSSPDHAFGLRVDAAAPPSRAVLCLARTDKESRFGSHWPDRPDVEVTDWYDDSEPHHGDLDDARTRLAERLSDDAPTDEIEQLMVRVARSRVDRGLRILSRGEAIVTDRLHGHILSLLLGRPQVILDSSYGKVFAVNDAWTSGFGTVVRADTPDEAVRTALELTGRKP